MECPICKRGKMVVATDQFREDGVAYELYRCSKCGEELLDGKQLTALAERYRALRRAKEVSFAKWGNSIAIRIPGEMVKAYGITAGRHAIITKEKEGMRIIPA